ncbi:hypothetical protein [Micromonospora sp. NPDC005220]|uniref:hypothetical protein n=1 Tax=Micromonospora sp. NPDC005220 TaxID=3155589 RepID=UPI00339FE02C
MDAATAKRFAQTCRMEAILRRKVIPAALIAVALIIIVHIVDSVSNDAQHLGSTLLVSLILLLAVLTLKLALDLRRSPHHPREMRGDVYINGVDRRVAETWIELNPAGSIKIVNR